MYWRINIDHVIPFFFESATKREVDAKRRRRGTTTKPKRKKKRSRISGRATLPPDRVNYGTISSGRYISPRLRTEPLLPATVRSILALVSSLPADSLLAWEGRGGERKRTCLSSLRRKTLARAWAFARTRKLRKGTGRFVNYRRNSSLCLVRVWFLFFSFPLPAASPRSFAQHTVLYMDIFPESHSRIVLVRERPNDRKFAIFWN